MKSLAVVLTLLFGCGSDGGSWIEQSVPTPTGLSVYTVWVSGEDDVWLGGTSIWHFDGSAWTETPPATPTGVVDFWGFSPTDVWGIGDARVVHWDGASWTDVPANNGVTFDALWRIWGASKTDLWIANTDNSRVFHYDGAMWTRTTLQFVSANALWGSSASDIWLTGQTSVYHYNGTIWAPYQGNDEPHDAYGLWGFGPNDMWAAGGFDELSHWNGTSWTPEDDQGASYNGIWGTATNDIYAVGDFGTVAHYDGSSWSAHQELDIGTNFTMVHGSSPGNVWATAVNLRAQKALVLRRE